ncbi:MAG: hypothetical protein GY862_00410 [Gammaproteobacteria bacterium]|nr:hypothetical protein [Gammaproteobacteria bacterium]
MNKIKKVNNVKNAKKYDGNESKILELVGQYFCRKSKESDDLRLAAIRGCMVSFALYDGPIDKYRRISEGIRNEKNLIGFEQDLFVTVCKAFENRFGGAE